MPNTKEGLSDEFILSQMSYYSNHLPRHGHDSYLVLGLYQKYRSKAMRRGLLDNQGNRLEKQ